MLRRLPSRLLRLSQCSTRRSGAVSERGAALHRLHDGAVGDEQAHQRGQVVGAPEAADVGLAAADGAAEGRVGEGLRMQDLERRVQVAVAACAGRRRGARRRSTTVSSPCANLRELGEEQRACRAAAARRCRCAADAPAPVDCRRRCWVCSWRRVSRCVRRGWRWPAPVLSGWVKNGMRLSQQPQRLPVDRRGRP